MKKTKAWTTARKKAFIIAALRNASQRYPPKYETLNKAKTGKETNKATGRIAEHYKCNACKKKFVLKDVQVDHILPVVSTKEGFVNWNVFIESLFCEVDNLQVLCVNCHVNIKTKQEREERMLIADFRKNHESTYQTWRNMNDRCNNPKATGYQYYGGKGIKVCPRWNTSQGISALKNFLDDMGERPIEKTLDRIDYTKDYTKQNCRWADAKEQARNTTANNWLEYKGETLILEEWGEKLGIKSNTILTRLRRGWNVGQALGLEEKPKQPYSGRLTQEDFLTIQDGLSQGKTLKEISNELEMDESQISRIATKFSLGKPPGGKTYEIDGEYLTLPAIAERFNICYETLVYRLNKGKTIKEAVLTPVRKSTRTALEREERKQVCS